MSDRQTGIHTRRATRHIITRKDTDMKTLIASALVATAALTGTAQAMTAPKIDSDAKYILPGADFSGLTAAEVLAINNALNSGSSNGEKQAFIRALLN